MTRDSQHVVAMVLIVWTVGVCIWALWASYKHRSKGAWKPGQRRKSWGDL